MKTKGNQVKELQANQRGCNEVTFLEMQIQYDPLNTLIYSILTGNNYVTYNS